LDAFKKKKILIRPFQLPNTPIKTKRDIWGLPTQWSNLSLINATSQQGIPSFYLLDDMGDSKEQNFFFYMNNNYQFMT
jgi:hypothetical protein